MEQEMVKAEAAGGALVPVQLVDQARDYAAQAKAPAIRRAYRADLRAFVAWCEAQALHALPAAPETLSLYLTARAQQGAKVATLERALAAISEAHKAAGHPSPRSSAVVQSVMRGIRRSLGVAPHQKTPVLVSDLKAMLQALPEGLLGLRDRALLLVGFAGAFRRSEIVGLDVADVEFTSEGLEVTLRRSKTDQEGAGRKIGIPYGSTPGTCPVRALKDWLDGAGIAEGPLLREVTRHGHVGTARLSGKTVARVVKRVAEAAGLDPERFSGHSLRAGLATSAAKAGKSERAIMKQGRWASVTMARRYIRDASLFTENAATGLL
jgi:integrase